MHSFTSLFLSVFWVPGRTFRNTSLQLFLCLPNNTTRGCQQYLTSKGKAYLDEIFFQNEEKLDIKSQLGLDYIFHLLLPCVLTPILCITQKVLSLGEHYLDKTKTYSLVKDHCLAVLLLFLYVLVLYSP